MRGKELLTNEQRQSFMDLNELSDWELAAYHTFSAGLSMLRQEKIILPAMTTIERAAWNARRHAEDTIFNHIHLLLTDVQKQALNKLLEPSRDGNKTTLSWLKESSGRTSP